MLCVVFWLRVLRFTCLCFSVYVFCLFYFVLFVLCCFVMCLFVFFSLVDCYLGLLVNVGGCC